MNKILIMVVVSFAYSSLTFANQKDLKLIVFNPANFTDSVVATITGVDSLFKVNYNKDGFQNGGVVDAQNNRYIFIGKSGNNPYKLYTVSTVDGSIIHAPTASFVVNENSSFLQYYYSPSLDKLVGIEKLGSNNYRFVSCDLQTATLTPIMNIRAKNNFYTTYDEVQNRYFLTSVNDSTLYIINSVAATLDSVSIPWANASPSSTRRSIVDLQFSHTNGMLYSLVEKELPPFFSTSAQIGHVNLSSGVFSELVFSASLPSSSRLSNTTSPFNHTVFDESNNKYVYGFENTSVSVSQTTAVADVSALTSSFSCAYGCTNSTFNPNNDIITHFSYNRLNQKIYGIKQTQFAPFTPQPLCQVSADSTSTHNIVVWEKTDKAAADSFYIYRETATNVYTIIASIPADSLSEYHDFSANPNTTAYRYKISVKDTNALLRPISDFHNTIHLQFLGGGNFSWNQYMIGSSSPVSSYELYYDTLANGNFTLFLTLPGTQTTATDINYSLHPNAKYKLVANVPFSCTPQRSSNSIFSNIVDQRSVSSITPNKDETGTIYPNPFGDYINIIFAERQLHGRLDITDITGKEIYTFSIQEKSVSIPTQKMTSGIYFLQFRDANGRREIVKMVKR